MKKLILLLSLCTLPFTASAIVVNSSVEANTVDYSYFSIDTDSQVRIETLNTTTFDPMMYLFHDNGSLDSTDLIASNDNGGTGYDALIDTYLGAGDYVVAIGDAPLTLEEAVSGSNSGSSGQGLPTEYQLEITATTANVTVGIPEPSTLALLGLGLMGVVAARRRRTS